jgi:hypothetical protein
MPSKEAHVSACLQRAVVAGVALWMTTSPGPALAQASFFQPWFNGFGVSLGGGSIASRGDAPTPVAAVIRPDGRVGAGAGGGFLALGTRRFSLTLPEFHVQSGFAGLELVSGTLTLGSATLPFTSTSRSVTSWAVLAGGQVGLVPSGRVWVRGGIGNGGISSHLDTDEGIAVDLSDSLGLAYSAAGGVTFWTRPGRNKHVLSLDAEVHYLRIRGGGMRVTLPSARIGFRFQPTTMP